MGEKEHRIGKREREDFRRKLRKAREVIEDLVDLIGFDNLPRHLVGAVQRELIASEAARKAEPFEE